MVGLKAGNVYGTKNQPQRIVSIKTVFSNAKMSHIVGAFLHCQDIMNIPDIGNSPRYKF